ncbi:MAG: aminotransferase class IV [Gammaproteobacteria bacterium]|nr:aminotransferase class IV [Gammaproteobacteria bacterium]
MTDSKFNIYLNKKTVPINDRAFNYGDGLFETILVKNNQIIYLKEHLNRLHRGCETISIKKPSLALIKRYSQTVIGKTKNCILKIILSRGASKFGYQIPKDLKPNLYFIKMKNIPVRLNKTEEVNLDFSKYKPLSNNRLSKIKHQNRMDQCLIANELLETKGCHTDLVVCHNDHIIETISSNLFFIKKIKDNYVFDTPRIDGFGIDGIIREKILEELRGNGFKANIKNIKRDNLQKYIACFKTNSINGLVFIDRIGKNKFSKPEILYNVLKSFIY